MRRSEHAARSWYHQAGHSPHDKPCDGDQSGPEYGQQVLMVSTLYETGLGEFVGVRVTWLLNTGTYSHTVPSALDQGRSAQLAPWSMCSQSYCRHISNGFKVPRNVVWYVS